MSNKLTFRWKWQLKSSPAQLWEKIADTESLNKQAGLPTGSGSAPNPSAAKFLFGSDICDQETKAAWIRNNKIEYTHRRPKSGVREVSTTVYLEKNDKGTLVKYELVAKPNGLLASMAFPYLVKKKIRAALGSNLKSLDTAPASNDEADAVALIQKAAPRYRSAIEKGIGKLAALGHEPQAIAQLVRSLIEESDTRLACMRPYQYADRWVTPRRKILSLFLSAVKAKLLRKKWILSCPSCQKEIGRLKSLTEVTSKVTCPHCTAEEEVDLCKDLELVFFPHILAREMQALDNRQLTNPLSAPSVIIQQWVQPNTQCSVPLTLPQGNYSIGTPDTPAEKKGLFSVQKGAQGEIYGGINGGVVQIIHKANTDTPCIRLANNTSEPQLIILEDDSWMKQRVTASDANCCTEYRRYFAQEAPSGQETLKVSDTTFVASDIVASTQLCAKLGDVGGYHLIREVYELQEKVISDMDGAIISSFGDALVAVFNTPSNAVEAAIQIQKEFQSYNATHLDGQHIDLKLATHSGNCVMVNLGYELDPFGREVNVTNRLVHESAPGDVTVSDVLLNRDGVAAVLESHQICTQECEAVKVALGEEDEPVVGLKIVKGSSAL